MSRSIILWTATNQNFLQPLLPVIIPSSSSRQECFHGFSVLNRLCVVLSHALLMADTDVGVIQVGFENWEWLHKIIFFFLIQNSFSSGDPLGADKIMKKSKVTRSRAGQKMTGKLYLGGACSYSDSLGLCKVSACPTAVARAGHRLRWNTCCFQLEVFRTQVENSG